jgi:hypothetical protein
VRAVGDAADETFDRWRDWLTSIERELVRAHFHQLIWTEMRDAILERFPDAHVAFLVSYSRVYAEAQMVAIRRLTDERKGVASLAALIRDIRRRPQVITRTRFVAQRPSDPEGAARTFDRVYTARPGDETISRALLDGDLRTLASRVADIKGRVDRTIAHLDQDIDKTVRSRRDVTNVVTYADIRDVLAFLGDLTNRYQALLTDSTMGDWTPVIEGDWHKPFRASLFPLDPSVYEFDPRSSGFV